jgi:hypothetical protein
MAKSKGISEQNILNELNDIYIPKPSIGDLFIYKEKPMAQETEPVTSGHALTAVDILFKQLWDQPKDKFIWYGILKQAKAMEKEQIIKAFESQKNCVEKYYEYAEDYYNETYNK